MPKPDRKRTISTKQNKFKKKSKIQHAAPVPLPDRKRTTSTKQNKTKQNKTQINDFNTKKQNPPHHHHHTLTLSVMCVCIYSNKYDLLGFVERVYLVYFQTMEQDFFVHLLILILILFLFLLFYFVLFYFVLFCCNL